jgi:hypothetical protein
MKRILLSALVLAFLFSCSDDSNVNSPENVSQNKYFPLKVGNYWHLKKGDLELKIHIKGKTKIEWLDGEIRDVFIVVDTIYGGESLYYFLYDEDQKAVVGAHMRWNHLTQKDTLYKIYVVADNPGNTEGWNAEVVTINMDGQKKNYTSWYPTRQYSYYAWYFAEGVGVTYARERNPAPDGFYLYNYYISE